MWNAAEDCHVKLEQVPFADEGVCAHAGFLGDVLALRSQTDAWLRSLGPWTSSSPLLCTGHSMGAACSGIAALAYAYAGFSVSWLSFGCPRFGNGVLARDHAARVREAIWCSHSYDPVCSCIPPGLYARVGSHVQLGAYDPFSDVCMPCCIGDHDMGEYLRCVREDDVVTYWSLRGWTDYVIQMPSTVCSAVVSLYYTWK